MRELVRTEEVLVVLSVHKARAVRAAFQAAVVAVPLDNILPIIKALQDLCDVKWVHLAVGMRVHIDELTDLWRRSRRCPRLRR